MVGSDLLPRLMVFLSLHKQEIDVDQVLGPDQNALTHSDRKEIIAFLRATKYGCLPQLLLHSCDFEWIMWSLTLTL